LCGVAVSRFGISSEDFYDMTPAEFTEAMEDWQEVQKVRTLEPIKAIWESTRWLAMEINNQNPYRKRTIKDPREVRKFPWDEKPKKQQTVEEQRRILYQIAKDHNTTQS